MAEARADAYDTAAGLLRNMGFSARAEAAWTPPGAARPVAALISDAPAVVIGYAVAITAEEPEEHLPPVVGQGGARRHPAGPGTPSGHGGPRQQVIGLCRRSNRG